jgi:hypothetical protein
MKNAEGYFVITVPKEVSDELELEGKESFSCDYDPRYKSLIYTRKDKPKKRKY